MPLAVIVSFVVLFALILFAVSVGLKFLDARRKAQVVDMLQTAAGENVAGITKLLKEIEPDKPTGIKAILRSLEFTRHAQEQLQQAGMTWSSTRLLAMMALLTIPGFALGIIWPILVTGPVTGVVFGCVFAALPYLFVRHKRKVRL